MSKLVRNTTIYFMANVIMAFVSFLIFPIISNRIGSSELGIYTLMQSVSSALILVMGISIDRSVYMLYFDSSVVEKKTEFVGSIFCFVLLFGLFITLLCILFLDNITALLNSEGYTDCVLLTIIYTYVGLIFSFIQVLYQINQKAVKYVTFSLLYVFLLNAFNVISIFYLRAEAISLLKSTFVVYLLVTLISLVFGKKYISFSFNRNYLKVALKCCIPMFISAFFVWMFTMSDRIFISKYVSTSAAGIYAVGMKFTSIITLFSAALYQAYQPVFYEKSNILSEKEAKIILGRTNDIICLLISLVFLIVVFFNKWTVVNIFKEEYYESIIYIYVLSFSTWIVQVSGLYNLMIYKTRKTVLISICGICAGLLSIGLNVVLLPLYGTIFAAITNLIVSIFVLCSVAFLAKRSFYIALPIKGLAFVLLIALLGIGAEEISAGFYLFFVKILLGLFFIVGIIKYKLFSFDMKMFQKMFQR